MHDFLFYLFINVSKFFITSYFLDYFLLDKKFDNFKHYSLLIAVAFANSLGNFFFQPGPSFFIISLTLFLIVLTLYQASILKKLVALVILFFLSTISEVIVAFNIEYFNLGALPHFSQAVCAYVLYFLLVFIIRKISGKNKEIGYPYLITLASSLGICFLFSIGTMHLEGVIKESLYFNLIIISLIIVIFFIMFFKFNQDKEISRLKVKSLEKEISNKKLYYQSLSSKEHEIRTLKHDLKNMISSIIASEKDLRTEMLKLVEGLDKSSPIISDNPIVNFILSSKLRNIEILEENLFINIKLTEELKIDPGDFGIVLGNCLDNAIEALEYLDLEDRVLKIVIILKLGVLYVVTENSFDKFQKKEGDLRGFGLDSIRCICKSYDGFLELSTDKYFIASAYLMNIPKITKTS